MRERKSYDEMKSMIERNARDILSGQSTEIGLKRANGCLLAILCETMLDIRESLGRGAVVPCCEVIEE